MHVLLCGIYDETLEVVVVALLRGAKLCSTDSGRNGYQLITQFETFISNIKCPRKLHKKSSIIK